jgi:hypothetical protein
MIFFLMKAIFVFLCRKRTGKYTVQIAEIRKTAQTSKSDSSGAIR